MISSNNVYIDIGTSWSKEIGLQLSPIPTNTTFLSKYINDFPKVYTAFPLYLLCPGAGIKSRPLSAAYKYKISLSMVVLDSKGLTGVNSAQFLYLKTHLNLA